MELDDSGQETISYGIHEVYYNSAGVPTTCSINPMSPYGETFEELVSDLRYFSEALEKPVLDFDSIGEGVDKK
jgi:hypothetical protein